MDIPAKKLWTGLAEIIIGVVGSIKRSFKVVERLFTAWIAQSRWSSKGSNLKIKDWNKETKCALRGELVGGAGSRGLERTQIIKWPTYRVAQRFRMWYLEVGNFGGRKNFQLASRAIMWDLFVKALVSTCHFAAASARAMSMTPKGERCSKFHSSMVAAFKNEGVNYVNIGGARDLSRKYMLPDNLYDSSWHTNWL